MLEEIKEEEYVSPLVVHNKDDASYQETASEVGLQTTHIDEESSDEPTLERHRFRKKKKKKYPYFIAILAVCVVVLIILFNKGVIKLGNTPEESTAPSTTKSYTTKPVNAFEGIITIKGTYIFFEGKELDGLEALEREIKYLDAGTKFTVQDEKADSNFMNFEILSLLSKYGIDYTITPVLSSGLISEYETTTTTTKQTTKKKSKKPKNDKASEASKKKETQ